MRLAIALSVLALGCAPAPSYTCAAGSALPVETCDPGVAPEGEGWMQWAHCYEPNQWIVTASGMCGAGWGPTVPVADLPCNGTAAGPAQCAWGCGWFREPYEDECADLGAACSAETCYTPAPY
jgi:hypothetical protein